MQCVIYHPLHLDGTFGLTPNTTTKRDMVQFVSEHDCTDSGNVTELSPESLDRFCSTPSFIGVLTHNNDIVGTMITPIFRAQYKGTSIITTYTTFLCIHKSHRSSGLAMGLIRAIMKEGYVRYGINHGYYLTFAAHHSISTKIESWYRPINIKTAGDAGFTLQSFSARGDRGNARQRLAYHVPKPSVLPVKAAPETYDIILKILQSGDLYLTPTKQELEWLCRCFDVYTVGTHSLFMLFPMVSLISSTGKRVRNAQVALMIGDALPQALWIANGAGYDLLYGWCSSEVTATRVTNIRGLVTMTGAYMESYNTRILIPNDRMMVPIF